MTKIIIVFLLTITFSTSALADFVAKNDCGKDSFSYNRIELLLSNLISADSRERFDTLKTSLEKELQHFNSSTVCKTKLSVNYEGVLIETKIN